MTTETLTLEQIPWALADATGTCACNGNVGDCGGDCKTCLSGECCGGRWGPFLFPELRKPCPYDRDSLNAHAMAGMLAETEEERNEKPPCCQGRGFVPDVTEAKLWLYIGVIQHMNTNEDVAGRFWAANHSRKSRAFGATALEAMMRALLTQAEAQ